jgi:hypothetical protein
MEIPIKYLEEWRCINNSRIVPRYVGAKEIKANWANEIEYVRSDYSPLNVQVYYYLEEDVNTKPEAHITLITPNPAIHNESIHFSGEGWDPDNDTINLNWKIMDNLFVQYQDPNASSIRAYEWFSSIDGFLSNNSSFNASNFSVGKHTIYFRVKDGGGKWSDNATTILTVKKGNTETINGDGSGILNYLQQNKTLIIPLVIILGILIGLIVIKVKIGKRKSRIDEGMIK